MPMLNIILQGDGCWPDLESKGDGAIISVDSFAVALMPGGMASGKASVSIRIDLPDGRIIIAQTSQALFDGAARAFRARLEALAELEAKGGPQS